MPLDTNIQDNAGNMTRFLVLSREPLAVATDYARTFKTSVVFGFREGPGQLIKALSVFALRDLPLYKARALPPPACLNALPCAAWSSPHAPACPRLALASPLQTAS